jgi:hypothetical protein
VVQIIDNGLGELDPLDAGSKAFTQAAEYGNLRSYLSAFLNTNKDAIPADLFAQLDEVRNMLPKNYNEMAKAAQAPQVFDRAIQLLEQAVIRLQ